MPVSTYISRLQDALVASLKCECSHLTCGLVHLKDARGNTVWRGMVETFALTGHPTATKAYAWGNMGPEPADAGNYVLASAEIDSPAAAVASVLSAGGPSEAAAGLSK